jgi:hypothetical protein
MVKKQQEKQRVKKHQRLKINFLVIQEEKTIPN